MLEKLYEVACVTKCSYSKIFNRYELEDEHFLHINVSLEDAIESLIRVSENGYDSDNYYTITELSYDELTNSYSEKGINTKIFRWNEEENKMELYGINRYIKES